MTLCVSCVSPSDCLPSFAPRRTRVRVPGPRRPSRSQKRKSTSPGPSPFSRFAAGSRSGVEISRTSKEVRSRSPFPPGKLFYLALRVRSTLKRPGRSSLQRELFDPLCWVDTMKLERRLGRGFKSRKLNSLFAN